MISWVGLRLTLASRYTKLPSRRRRLSPGSCDPQPRRRRLGAVSAHASRTRTHLGDDRRDGTRRRLPPGCFRGLSARGAGPARHRATSPTLPLSDGTRSPAPAQSPSTLPWCRSRATSSARPNTTTEPWCGLLPRAERAARAKSATPASRTVRAACGAMAREHNRATIGRCASFASTLIAGHSSCPKPGEHCAKCATRSTPRT